jgi:hypothetical protein
MTADAAIAILVDIDSIVDLHLRGRAREGKPVVMLGRRWSVELSRECDGKRLVQLRADERDLVDDHGSPMPLMCCGCGGFNMDKPDGAMWECADCGSRRLLP